MSTQSISVVGVIGGAARAVRKHLMNVRHLPEPLHTLEHLRSRLRNHAHKPPIVFYEQYMDYWSIRSFLVDLACSRNASSLRRIEAGMSLWLWMEHSLTSQHARRLKRQYKYIATQEGEARRFVNSLLLATEAVARATDNIVVICMMYRRGSVTDDEIGSSIVDVPRWCMGLLTDDSKGDVRRASRRVNLRKKRE